MDVIFAMSAIVSETVAGFTTSITRAALAVRWIDEAQCVFRVRTRVRRLWELKAGFVEVEIAACNKCPILLTDKRNILGFGYG